MKIKNREDKWFHNLWYENLKNIRKEHLKFFPLKNKYDFQKGGGYMMFLNVNTDH